MLLLQPKGTNSKMLLAPQVYITAEMFDGDLARAVAYSGSTGHAVYLTGGVTYTLPIGGLTFVEGARLLGPDGSYSPVGRAFVPPKQPGMAKIVAPVGLAVDAITFPKDAYGTALTGCFIDLTNQTAGKGVVLSDTGSGSTVYRPDIELKQLHIYKAFAQCLHIEPNNHEAQISQVFCSDSQTSEGALIEGGDIYLDRLQAAYNATVGIHFLHASAIRGWGVEAFLNGTDNILFEGFCRQSTFFKLVSDTAGHNGIRIAFAQFQGGANYGPYDVKVWGLHSSGSGTAVANTYDDLHIDPTSTVGGASTFDVYGGDLGAAATPVNTRYCYEWTIPGGFSNNTANSIGVTLYNVDLNIVGVVNAITPFGPNAILYTQKHVDCRFVANSSNNAPSPKPSNPAIGVYNLIQNGSFDYWTDDGAGNQVPLAWLSRSTATLAKETGIVHSNLNALKITASASVGSGANQPIISPQGLIGKNVTVTGWCYNPSAEPVANNTTIFLQDGVTTQSVIIPSFNGWQYFRLSMTINSASTFVNFVCTPATNSAATGRSIYLDDVAIYVGESDLDYLPANPKDRDVWTTQALVVAGGNVALDLRSGATRYKVTLSGAGNFVGLVNAVPNDEIFIKFLDANATMVSSFNLQFSDGTSASFAVAINSTYRFIWDGGKWIVFRP